jgi:hypothetical protein
METCQSYDKLCVKDTILALGAFVGFILWIVY